MIVGPAWITFFFHIFSNISSKWNNLFSLMRLEYI